MMLSLYKAVTILGGPLIRIYLSRRMARGKEDPARFGERLGQAGLPRPQGQLVWLHGASVGESISLLPLIERLHLNRPGRTILVTTGTVTSAKLMNDRLPEKALHQYLPVDRPAYVKRFLGHWQPDLVLWAESEFWPNMIVNLAARSIPLVLINGRISAASFKTWQRFPGMIGTLLSAFSLCLGQTEIDAERLRTLGARNTKCVGNLKFAAPPLPAEESEQRRLQALLSDRPRWLAASTHAGEEALVARVHQSLASDHGGLLTIIVPRHPERGAVIATELSALGLTVARRSLDQAITEQTDIYVADTLGELGLFYRLSQITLIGKSIVGQGGQNPLEPARLNSALIMGPHMDNFEDITASLKEAEACVGVSDETTLAQAVSRLLADPVERNRMTAAAAKITAMEDGVLDAVIEQILPFLAAGDSDADA